MLSIILAVDDFFLIHDRYIDQKFCYLVYAILAIAILIRHNKKILEIEGFAFLVAGSFLALSILTDVIQSRIPMQYGYTQVFEEGFKFIGAATWLYFNSRIASYR
jgi:disulfide bond formation protein DsbB